MKFVYQVGLALLVNLAIGAGGICASKESQKRRQPLPAKPIRSRRIILKLAWGCSSMKIKYQSIGFALFATATTFAGAVLPVMAFPYQDFGPEFYTENQAPWRELIKREPKNPNGYLQLGNWLTRDADAGYWTDCYNHSIAVYRQGIAAATPNAEIHFKMGQALRVEPDSTYCTLDTVEELRDPAKVQARRQEGLSHLRQAMSIDPSNDEYPIAVGNALKEEGQLEAAIAAYKTAINLPFQPNQVPEIPFVKASNYETIGQEFEKRADFETALVAYRRAVAIYPDDSVQRHLEELAARLKLKTDEK
jgi:tetratricopeptide (TPR) repeat protein